MAQTSDTQQLQVLWAGEKNCSARLELFEAMEDVRRYIDVVHQSCEGCASDLAALGQRVSAADLLIADFGGTPQPVGGVDAVVAATLARYCTPRTHWIVVDRGVDLPFDWNQHAPIQATKEKLAMLLLNPQKNAHSPRRPGPRVAHAEPTVFLAMPFQGYWDAVTNPAHYDFTRTYEAVRAAVGQAGLDPDRQLLLVANSRAGGGIISDIEEVIARASVVVADFSPDARSGSHPNPNVLTEAILARAAYGHEKTLILIAQKGTSIPRAWGVDFRTSFYDGSTSALRAEGGQPLAAVLAGRLSAALGAAGLDAAAHRLAPTTAPSAPASRARKPRRTTSAGNRDPAPPSGQAQEEKTPVAAQVVAPPETDIGRSRTIDQIERARAAREAAFKGDCETADALLSELFTETGNPSHLFNQGSFFQLNHRYEEAMARFEKFLHVTKGDNSYKDARQSATRFIKAYKKSLATSTSARGSAPPSGQTQAEKPPVAEVRAPPGPQDDVEGLAVHFKTRSTDIMRESYALLEHLLRVFETNPDLTRIRIAGHADWAEQDVEDGDSPVDLLQLSIGRALAVQSWLEGHGLAHERCLAVGFADADPIGDSQTAQGRAQNRRVDFQIIERGGKLLPGESLSGGGTIASDPATGGSPGLAVGLDPADSVLATQARDAFAAGDYRGACDSYAKLFAITNSPAVLREIAQCYRKLGDFKNALTCFREYLRKAVDLQADERMAVERQIVELEALRERTAAPESHPTSSLQSLLPSATATDDPSSPPLEGRMKAAQQAPALPQPLSYADAEQAARLNAEYQRQLSDWKALPGWKRFTTPKPKPPEGI